MQHTMLHALHIQTEAGVDASCTIRHLAYDTAYILRIQKLDGWGGTLASLLNVLQHFGPAYRGLRNPAQMGRGDVGLDGC